MIDTTRVDVAMRLARDLETCQALLAGRTVDQTRLDEEQLQWAYNAQLVRLVRPVDVLLGD